MKFNLQSLTPAGIFAVLLAAGCIPSLHPIYTEQDLVGRDQILGRWSSTTEPQTWEFSQEVGKAYQLVYADKEGRSASFDVRLTEISGDLFMDLYPRRDGQGKPGFYSLHFLPTHTFYRIGLDEESLSLSFLNPQWLKQYQKEHPDHLAHVRKDKSILLTADTATLRRFVSDHHDTEGAFTKPFVLKKDSP